MRGRGKGEGMGEGRGKEGRESEKREWVRGKREGKGGRGR